MKDPVDVVSVTWKVSNKYGSVQELRSTFSHIKSINIDLDCGLVSSYVDQMGQTNTQKT